eukprot:jgi/Botrbrau1/22732/Bobra.0132s0070.1
MDHHKWSSWESERRDSSGSPCKRLSGSRSGPVTFFNARAVARECASAPVIPSDPQPATRTSPPDVTATAPPVGPLEGSLQFHTAHRHMDASGTHGGSHPLDPSPLLDTARARPWLSDPGEGSIACPGNATDACSGHGFATLGPGTQEALDPVAAMSRAVNALALRAATLRRNRGLPPAVPRVSKAPSNIVSPAPQAPMGEAGILLQELPIAGVRFFRGSMLLVSLTFEEIAIGSAALRKAPSLADLYIHNLLQTQEVGVIDREGHLDDPIFLLKEGAQYIVKVIIAAGSGRRWVPLPVAGADYLHVSIANSPQTFLEVKELSQVGGRWTGCCVWDSSVELGCLTGEHATLTFTINMDLKGGMLPVRVKKTVAARVLNPTEEPEPAPTSQRSAELRAAVSDIPWALPLAQGAVSFHSVAAAGYDSSHDLTPRNVSTA